VNVVTLFQGPEPVSGPLRLGPLDAAVVLKNGRPSEVRRSGKYRRILSAKPLGVLSELHVLMFHTGQVPLAVTVPSVPLADDMVIDCTVHMGVQFVGGDDTLLSLASKFSSDNFRMSLEQECAAVARKLVFQALGAVSHDDLRRSDDLEAMFRSGRRVLDGTVEIVAIHRIEPKLDKYALVEIAERKGYNLEKARIERDRELQKSRAESDRELKIYKAITTTMVDEISAESRAKIAVKIGQELGIPPLWVYNPDAYVTEIAGNQKLLIDILGKYGSDFAMLADQFDLSRDDFLRIFNGLQQKVIDVVSESTSAPPGDPFNGAHRQYAHSELVMSALRSTGFELSVVASSHSIDNGILRAVVVAHTIGTIRSDLSALEHALVESGSGAYLASVVIASYGADVALQVDTIVQSIIAESDQIGSAVTRKLADDEYAIALDPPGFEVIAPWKLAISRVFKPAVKVHMERALPSGG